MWKIIAENVIYSIDLRFKMACYTYEFKPPPFPEFHWNDRKMYVQRKEALRILVSQKGYNQKIRQFDEFLKCVKQMGWGRTQSRKI